MLIKWKQPVTPMQMMYWWMKQKLTITKVIDHFKKFGLNVKLSESLESGADLELRLKKNNKKQDGLASFSKREKKILESKDNMRQNSYKLHAIIFREELKKE